MFQLHVTCPNSFCLMCYLKVSVTSHIHGRRVFETLPFVFLDFLFCYSNDINVFTVHQSPILNVSDLRRYQDLLFGTSFHSIANDRWNNIPFFSLLKHFHWASKTIPLSLAMNMDQDMFCGRCFEDCGTAKSCTFRGALGQWQQFGDWRENEKKWTFLCTGCSRLLWRLYSKCESGNISSHDSFNKDYMIFLAHELARNKK